MASLCRNTYEPRMTVRQIIRRQVFLSSADISRMHGAWSVLAQLSNYRDITLDEAPNRIGICVALIPFLRFVMLSVYDRC
jgi:hypothetical protein